MPIRKFIKGNHWKWISFAVVFIFFLGYFLIKDQEFFPYDSYYYWTEGDGVVAKAGFHISEFPETFRGYFFPVLLSVLKQGAILLGHEFLAWRLLCSLLLGLLFCFVFPRLFRMEINSLWFFIRIIALLLVVLYFWGDFLQYPLSDMPAMVFVCLGACLLQTICEGKQKSYHIVLSAFFAGICLYAAYNTRAVYLYADIILVILFFVRERKNVKKVVITVCSVGVGILLLAIPQMMINRQYVGVYSPRVFTEQYQDYSESLQLWQIHTGVEMPRVEAYLGPEELFPGGMVRYIDDSGMEILNRAGMSDGFSWVEYGKLVIHYPLDMIGLYARHLVSIMTPTYRELYISDMWKDKSISITLAVLIWLIAGLILIVIIKEKKHRWNDMMVLFALSIPSILQVAGAVELRFFIAIYFFAYFGVFVATDYRWIWNKVKPRILPIITAMIIIFALWIAIVGEVVSSYNGGVLLMNDDRTWMMEK